jgi:hypothetical protein
MQMSDPAFDLAAIVLRAEEIVELLSTRRESFDTDRAAEFLRDVRRWDEQKILGWAYDHGVSSDWLLFGDPSSMILRLANYSYGA